MTRILAVLLLLSSAAFAGGGPENVLVVQNDLCPDSVDIARYYVVKRDVPRHHVVHVRIPGGPAKPKKGGKKDPKAPADDDGWDPRESFASFDEYCTLLQEPVRAWILAHPGSHITTIALTRGIPVCAPVKNAKGNEIVRATAHMLGGMFVEKDDLRTGPEGVRGNPSPFYKCDESIDPAAPLKGEWRILCVGHLDAFTLADAKRAIDLAVQSDSKRPDGTVYLGQSAEKDPRGMYNPSFPQLADFIKGLGMKTETVAHNPNNVLLEGKKDVATYAFGQAGWDETFPAKNAYQPGALVDNITSVAMTWRSFVDGSKGGQTPMTWFTRAGATVVHGCVREPTTGAWDPEYLHIQRYLSGYNVIESFFMGHPWYPWMNLVAGDPLTQPFAQRPEVKGELTGAKGAWRLKVAAKATREGAALKSLEVFVDGVKAGDAQDGAEFDLGTAFDPAVNSWRVVATDDSKFRTQGSAASAPLKGESGKLSAKLDGYYKGSAALKLGYDGKEPVVTWCAEDAKDKVGTVKGYRFSILFEDDTKPHSIDLWVRNAKGEAPVVLRVEVPAKKR
ncbi:MAG: TIGR03790 family protein [Planctomycetes bacterium]|nr:TIGR03790 family protein [Planctomycetota bacterium]